MTVYVDSYLDAMVAAKWRGGGHMLGSDLDELHEMAQRIGLRRSWFQGHSTFAHYDLTASKRRLALEAGAVSIAPGDLPGAHSFVDALTDALAGEVDRLTRALTNTTERWYLEVARRQRLEHGVQVCPFGCGWHGRRTLPGGPDDRQVRQFLDVCGLDLAEHLAGEHGATDAVRVDEGGAA